MTRRVDTLNRFAVGCTLDGQVFSTRLATTTRPERAAALSVDDAINLAAWLIVCARAARARTEIGFTLDVMDEVRELVDAIEAP